MVDAKSKQVAACVWEAKADLGEGPLWVERDQALYFVDLLAGKVLRYRPADGVQTAFQVTESIGFIAPRLEGGFIAGMKSGFCFLDFDGGQSGLIAAPEPELPNSRFNDGKVDPSGRLWAGTLDVSCAVPVGTLYQLQTDLSWQSIDTGYLCPNGPAFSRDGRTLFHADSMRRLIYAFDLELKTGVVANKRIFAQFAEEDGYPDGMTVDADDRLWVAHYGGGRLTAYWSDGSIDQTIQVPAPLVTSCAFGGDDLSTLYITTARNGLTAAQRSEAPQSGGLFAIEGIAKGLASTPFGG